MEVVGSMLASCTLVVRGGGMVGKGGGKKEEEDAMCSMLKFSNHKKLILVATDTDMKWKAVLK